MASWPPETWVDDEQTTVALLTTRVKTPFDDLNAHTHDGSGGDGSADILPDSVRYTDQSAPAAPGSGLTNTYAVSGKLHQRAGASGNDEEFDIVGHGHTLQEVAQSKDDEGVADQTGDFGSRQTQITSTYGAIGRRRVTLTPASAKAAVVCAGTIHRRNGRNGAGTITFSDRIVVGGSQRKEITRAVSDGDGTAGGSNHSVGSTAYTEIDGAASSTNYDWEHKESANDSDATIQDFGNALIVTEVSV